FFPYGNHTDFLAPLKALSPLFEAMLYRFKSIGLPTLFHDEPEYEQDNPITKWLPATQLYYSIEPVIKTMLSGVTTLLREIQNELYCDIIDSGIVISGGGALLPGMRERVSAETGLKVCLAPDPLNAVVIGARSILPFASMLDF
ncbi:MAG: rod shape-determining protein, partial [Nitrospirota bacterium]